MREEQELGCGAQRTLVREGFLVINPFERPEQAEYERALAGKGLTKDQCYRIVGGDLAKIDESALLAALITDKASVGTFMEIFYARRVRNIPVVVLTGEDRAANHPWIRSLTTVTRHLTDWLDFIKAKLR